jgi:hypothetical protein
MTKGRTMIYKTIHRKLIINEPHKKYGEHRYRGRIGNSCSTSDTLRVTVK